MQASCPLQGCHYSVTGKDESDIMRKLAEHGREQHGITKVSEDLKRKIEQTFKP